MHDSIDYIQRLRTLPTETAPPYNWQEFQRRAAPARGATEWRPLAVAAALRLVVCAIAVWGRFGGGRHLVADSAAVEDGGRNSDRTVGQDRQSPSLAEGTTTWSARVTDGSGDRDAAQPDGGRSLGTASAGPTQGESGIAARRSRAIESWLATLPQEPAVVRVGTRAAVAGLEDRIAQVDDLMTSMRIDGTRSDRLAALQQDRLRLVGSLAQVRYAEVVASRSP
jgi:hypothetical protein